jgi:enoyl-CoA hydratase
METVLFEKRDGTLKVSLNRTPVLNAINSDVLRALESGIKTHRGDGTIKALMLYGQGGCFAAGADIKELASLDESGIRKFHDLRERTFDLLEEFPSPTFAVIEKFALGTGLELALCCDFRIAEEGAQMGVPSARLGLVESYAYISRLVRSVGPAQAKKMIFSGERVDAGTAFTIGLVEEITSPQKLFDRADALLSNILNNSNYALRQSKKVVDVCARDPNLNKVMDTALPLVESLKSPDFKEGSTAFLEKRKANFK